MRNIIHALTIVSGFFFIVPSAYACAPCRSPWSLQKSIEHADLIIIGRRMTPLQPGEDRVKNIPEYIDVSVESVLKGNLEQTQVIVKALRGDGAGCSVGVATSLEKPYVMIMKKIDGNAYDAVDSHCGISTMGINGDNVTTPDISMTLENFKQIIK